MYITYVGNWSWNDNVHQLKVIVWSLEKPKNWPPMHVTLRNDRSQFHFYHENLSQEIYIIWLTCEAIILSRRFENPPTVARTLILKLQIWFFLIQMLQQKCFDISPALLRIHLKLSFKVWDYQSGTRMQFKWLRITENSIFRFYQILTTHSKGIAFHEKPKTNQSQFFQLAYDNMIRVTI